MPARRLSSLLLVLALLAGTLVSPAVGGASEDSCSCCVDVCHCDHGRAAAPRRALPAIGAAACAEDCQAAAVAPGAARLALPRAAPVAVALSARPAAVEAPAHVVLAGAHRPGDGRGPPLPAIS